MKTWFISIALIVLVGFPRTVLAAPSEPDSGTPLQAIVHIVHTQRLLRGNTVFIHETDSLGTAVGPHLILTHNHFGATLGTQPDEMFTVNDATGRSFSVRVAEVKRIAFGGGTLLLQFPDTINLTARPLADQAAITDLNTGDWVTVNYWDDANQRLASKAFQFIQTANGVATLADPDHVINPGDSGGGVFFEGRLIGNTWSYNADGDGNALGSFNVAVVPLQMQNNVN